MLLLERRCYNTIDKGDEALSEKKRMLWLDIAKGFAIATVVLGHCLSDTTALHDWVYSFHMPLFFMLAGFTMRAKPRLEVLKSSFRRLLIPYFIVCAILLFFAFVPPESINANLDSQRSVHDVIIEILFASGQEGGFFGHTYQAIGAIWFLPCLFWGRLLLNEVLLRTQNLEGFVRVLEPALVACILAFGFLVGNEMRLPADFDTACIAVLFMYIGVLAKRFDLSRVSWWQWCVLICIWFMYLYAGSNEMAVRAYLEHPWSLVTASAGSLVIMKACMLAEQLPLGKIHTAFVWMGVSSLTILCVHRVESAIFNWQKIMEFIRPDVWDWDVLYQGLYWFVLRYVLVIICAYIVVKLNKTVRAKFAEYRHKTKEALG